MQRECHGISVLPTSTQTIGSTKNAASTFDHIIACFGTQRILWGSDWPVVELAGGYTRWHAATNELIGGLGPQAQAEILGGNARRFYGIQ